MSKLTRLQFKPALPAPLFIQLQEFGLEVLDPNHPDYRDIGPPSESQLTLLLDDAPLELIMIQEELYRNPDYLAESTYQRLSAQAWLLTLRHGMLRFNRVKQREHYNRRRTRNQQRTPLTNSQLAMRLNKGDE